MLGARYALLNLLCSDLAVLSLLGWSLAKPRTGVPRSSSLRLALDNAKAHSNGDASLGLALFLWPGGLAGAVDLHFGG